MHLDWCWSAFCWSHLTEILLSGVTTCVEWSTFNLDEPRGEEYMVVVKEYHLLDACCHYRATHASLNICFILTVGNLVVVSSLSGLMLITELTCVCSRCWCVLICQVICMAVCQWTAAVPSVLTSYWMRPSSMFTF